MIDEERPNRIATLQHALRALRNHRDQVEEWFDKDPKERAWPAQLDADRRAITLLEQLIHTAAIDE